MATSPISCVPALILISCLPLPRWRSFTLQSTSELKGKWNGSLVGNFATCGFRAPQRHVKRLWSNRMPVNRHADGLYSRTGEVILELEVSVEVLAVVGNPKRSLFV